MTQNLQLTHKQARFIHEYLTAPTLTDACRKVGVSDETGRRWLKLSHIQQAYNEASRAMFEEALKELQNSIGLARRTLTRNLSEETPNAQQVAAAKILLEKAIEVGKLQELETRLAELEKKLSERQD